MSSAKVIAQYYWQISSEANNVDPEQTAPIREVWSGSTLFSIEAP